MNIHLQKLLQTDSEKEFLELLRENSQLKSEWDKFIEEDEAEAKKFLNKISKRDFNVDELFLYMKGEADALLTEEIESDSLYRYMKEAFEKPNLTEGQNKIANRILANVQSHLKDDSGGKLLYMHLDLFQGKAASDGFVDEGVLQERFKQSPFHFAIDEAIKVCLFFNNKPAVLQIDLRDTDGNPISGLVAVKINDKSYEAKDDVCSIPLEETKLLKEAVIHTTNHEKGYLLRNLKQID